MDQTTVENVEIVEDAGDAVVDAAAPEAKAKTNKNWFVIHTYSGYENKVKANLERRIHSMNMQDKIFRVLVPMEDEVEFKDGKRKITPKKVFPGYVLVEMDMDDASWYVVRNTSGVTGFVGSPGSGEKPVPLQDKEVKTILKQMGIETPKLKIDFAKGDRVKVTSGPFFDFTGIVDDIQPEKERFARSSRSSAAKPRSSSSSTKSKKSNVSLSKAPVGRVVEGPPRSGLVAIPRRRALRGALLRDDNRNVWLFDG